MAKLVLAVDPSGVKASFMHPAGLHIQVRWHAGLPPAPVNIYTCVTIMQAAAGLQRNGCAPS